MPLPPSPLLRFARFARRFAPLWLVWLGILALPPAREILVLQLPGSPLAPQLNLIGREDLPPDSHFDAFKIAAQYPADLNARLWRFSQMLDGLGTGFDKIGYQNRRAYRPAELLSEADAISAAFPREKWLVSLPLRALRAPLTAASNPNNHTAAAQAARPELLRRLQVAARAEPSNALYPLLEAGIWRAAHNDGPMLAALSRASRCAVLDGHDGAWAQALMRAHELARPLILEEKSALWDRESGLLWWQNGVMQPSSLSNRARLAQRAGDHRRAIAIGVMLGALGDLMQRRPNTVGTAYNGREWKSQMWALRYRKLPFQSYSPRVRRSGTLWARSFSAYAAAHGRPDVAALDKKWRARNTQFERQTGYNWRLPPPQPPRDALWWVEFWRNAGIFVGAQLLYVAAAWLLVNLILWRGVGAPSTSRQRFVPALWLAFASAALAWWCWQQINFLMAMQMRWTMGIQHLIFATGSVALLAFFGPPFLLALWAAVAAMRRHQREFQKPARIDTELRLTRAQTVLLRAGPTILAAAGLGFTLGIWLLWLGLVGFDVTTLDPFGWFSASAIGPQPVEWLVAPLGYCLFIDGLGFLLWFNKWRYYAGKESRPLTHGGLRHWKESLGIYLVIGSAIYGGVAVCGWPARAEASRALETRLMRSELAP